MLDGDDDFQDKPQHDVVWDVFISHASEDKTAVALPLAGALERAGLKVWLDAQELTIGDSLAGKIDHGLSKSRFGAVILSEAFFAKEWPLKEMNALLGLESARGKVLLPVLHGIDLDTVVRYSPLIAGRLAASTDRGIQHVAVEIANAVRASLAGPRDASTSAPDRVAVSGFLRPEALEGEKIDGYLLGPHLGRGGSGIIFRASHAQRGDQLAMKIFYPLSGAYAHFDSLFERGFRALSRLKHPNIAPLNDSGQAILQGQNVFYLVTDYVEGPNLQGWTTSIDGDHDALAKRVRLALQLASGMQAAHETSYNDEFGFQVHGVLHGDLKPSNVIVTGGDTPVLLDFMLVDVQRLLDPRVIPPYLLRKDQGELTGAFGTPGFMAPEQAEHGVVSISTDIYGLGVTLCCLFLPGCSSPPLRARADRSLPKAVKNLLVEMTENDSRMRPRSMSEVIARLGYGETREWFRKLRNRSR